MIENHTTIGLAAITLAVVVGSVSAAEPLSVVSVLHHDEALNRPHDIEVQDRLAFIPGKGGSLAVVDVCEPQRPRLLWWTRDQKELDDSQTVLPLGRHLLLGARHLFSLDIRSFECRPQAKRQPVRPGNPTFTQKVSDRPRIDRINGMVRRGGFVLTANKNGWISVFDVRDPARPVLHDALDAEKFGELVSPHDIAAWGDHIAVVDQSGRSTVQLRLYGVADPTTHCLLPASAWKVAGAIRRDDLRGANRVVVAAGYAFVACSQGENFTLGFIDVRDPKAPRHLKTIPFADVHPTGLTVCGNVLFAAGGQAIQVIDVSRPKLPKTLAVFKSRRLFPSGRDNAHDLVYRDGFLYVTAQNDNQIGIVRVNDARILKLTRSRLDPTACGD